MVKKHSIEWVIVFIRLRALCTYFFKGFLPLLKTSVDSDQLTSDEAS